MVKERTRILLIDDEEVLLDLISEVLRDHGYSVTALASGPDALEAFLGSPREFDLVVADEKMPHLSGTDLAEEILRVRPDIPVILYTDYPEISSAKKARAIGVRTVLQKSSRTEELVAYIRRLLES
jgi:CheY-like chemotaxis protein